jgi:signal recognition particle receptor subunit beta
MPSIDPTRGVLVIRIVYDGPALSGKTTSLRALAHGVGSEVACPEERDGRTIFFDWMDYIGGLFEGRQIRCQIVSAPGQVELSKRRDLLLRDADAVVCVLDTRAGEMSYGIEWLAKLVPYCRNQNPPVGIVLQANKRDAPDATPREQLRERLKAVAPIGIVETIATGSEGIREAFVLAVRLALDRVRALSIEGRLPVGVQAVDGPETLLRAIRETETKGKVLPEVSEVIKRPSTIPPFFEIPRANPSSVPPAAESASEETTFVPDPMMPGGMIWPPVDGRAHLHEVAKLDIRPFKTPRGDWWASASGWRFHSRPRALFSDHNRARDELIAWARLHSACAQQISAGRVVILADAGFGQLRLWQIVRVDSLLREQLAHILSSEDPQEIARGMLEIAVRLTSAREWFEGASARLPCTLWTVGASTSYRPEFAGLMPDSATNGPVEPHGRELIERELIPHLRDLRRMRVDYLEISRRVMSLAETSSPQTPVRWLAEIVLGVNDRR